MCAPLLSCQNLRKVQDSTFYNNMFSQKKSNEKFKSSSPHCMQAFSFANDAVDFSQQGLRNDNCRLLYCVHPLHPKHLIFRFERFGNVILFSKLFYQPREHFLRLLIQINKITDELSAENQTVIQTPAVLTDISKMPPSPYAKVLLFFLRDRQAGNVIIALQFIPKTVVFVVNVLVHIQNPPYNKFAYMPQCPGFYMLLYCFIRFSFPCFCPYEVLRERVTPCETV